MEKKYGFCPRCDQQVGMHDDGSGHGANEFQSPMVFDDHEADDWRGGVNFRQECAGSGRNWHTARYSM